MCGGQEDRLEPSIAQGAVSGRARDRPSSKRGQISALQESKLSIIKDGPELGRADPAKDNPAPLNCEPHADRNMDGSNACNGIADGVMPEGDNCDVLPVFVLET